MFARTALTARNIAKAKPLGRSVSYVESVKPPTMADLPVPQGSWKEAHSQKQRKNNLQLLGGILIASGTLVYAKESGLVVFGFGPKVGK
ncbi:uncharacterized protein LOC121876320 [Homarus americanus]|uniref:Putative Deltamethrin resistance-containing protein n=1 Tax=Homarus americanus TaxID=6706 RepID=A0A8J5JLM9_HOMAM|nr:uncharacterized protein LOC121876320 [Homarus americanus]KAG7160617.1 putative Deltamethrin resistance-containing protein [Homarus americanus]